MRIVPDPLSGPQAGLASLVAALILLVAPLVGQGAALGQTRPLLVEGRQTVYQRVLTRADARLFLRPGAADGTALPPLNPLYVYAVEPGWFQVGPTISQGPRGWVRMDAVVPWRQNIVAAFTNPVGRNRQILFATEERLRWLLDHEAVVSMQPEIVEQSAAGTPRPDWQVMALEPAEHIDIQQQFYVLPILDFVEDLHPLTYEPNILLELASVPAREDAPAADPQQRGLDAGIVFVFDTTLSMDPFIDRTRAAMERIVSNIAQSPQAGRVHFGVLSFRDNVDAVPGLGYRTNLRLPLARRDDQQQVLDVIREAARVTTVSSPGFNEDSLAGVEDAIDLMDWDDAPGGPFAARVIILITDAGPKDPRDPNARSDIGPAQLQRIAQDRNIALMTVHLRTTAGGDAQHLYAEGQYRQLSRFHNNTYYYPIVGGRPDAFEAAISRLVDSLLTVIGRAADDDPAGSDTDLPPEIVDYGLALRLTYLGQQAGTRAPDLIRGWMSERAVENPAALAVEPRLLVTKNELATMAGYLAELLDLGERGQSAEDAALFFDQVRDVIARMAQDPEMLIAPGGETLGGALEFLDGLPYRSQILTLTPERWAQSALNRRQVLDGMRQRQALYRRWLFDPTVWTALHPDAPDGEHVLAMPFDALP